jgi:hypothetical protein
MSINRDHELCSGDGDDAVGLELECRAAEGDFERRGLSRIAHERVSKAMRKRVHRSCDRNTFRLKSPASEILHGCEKTGTKDVD